MARARTIKPGFFKSEQLIDCSAFARLLFAGLWLIADRDGRLEDRPRQIKGEIFPHDQLDCDVLLEELAAVKLIARYVVEDIEYIQILKFAEHQNPHPKEPASKIPPLSTSALPRKETAGNVITRPATETPEQAGPSPSSPFPSPHSNAADERAALRSAKDQVLEAMGVRDSPNWLGDAGMTEAWLRSGADLELDILPTIRRLMAKRGQDPPRSLGYFSQAIADSLASRTQPLPPGKPQRQKIADGPATALARAAAEVLAERPTDHGTPRAPDVALLPPERGSGDVEGQVIRLAR